MSSNFLQAFHPMGNCLYVYVRYPDPPDTQKSKNIFPNRGECHIEQDFTRLILLRSSD